MTSSVDFEMHPTEELFFTFVCLNYELLSKTFIGYFKHYHSLTPIQMNAIAYIKAHSGLTMTDLAHKLNISKQQATQLATSLVKREFAKRSYDSDNHRTVRIVPTQKAAKLLSVGEQKYIQNALEEISALSPEEQQETFDAMRVLIRTLPKCNFDLT